MIKRLILKLNAIGLISLLTFSCSLDNDMENDLNSNFLSDETKFEHHSLKNTNEVNNLSNDNGKNVKGNDHGTGSGFKMEVNNLKKTKNDSIKAVGDGTGTKVNDGGTGSKVAGSGTGL